MVGDEEVISLLHAKVLRIFRFCVMSWKDESEPNIKFCLGRKNELVQEFITIQNFHGLNKLVTDLIDKEYDDNEQETSEMKSEELALKHECTCFCEPIKG